MVQLYANDDQGRTTEYEIVLSVMRGPTWTYTVVCNGEEFTVETIVDPDPRHLVGAILDAYAGLQTQKANVSPLHERLLADGDPIAYGQPNGGKVPTDLQRLRDEARRIINDDLL